LLYCLSVVRNNADKAMETLIESAKRIVQNIQLAYGPCLFAANE
jgi:hypothetical protein